MRGMPRWSRRRACVLLMLTHPFTYHNKTNTRTERIQPLNLKDGVTLRRRLPLDGTEGHAKLEVRANLCLPEPEVRGC